jgi:hypothetical protein
MRVERITQKFSLPDCFSASVAVESEEKRVYQDAMQ